MGVEVVFDGGVAVVDGQWARSWLAVDHAAGAFPFDERDGGVVIDIIVIIISTRVVYSLFVGWFDYSEFPVVVGFQSVVTSAQGDQVVCAC
ncbi:MAG: hypothetical protein WC054_02940, partial [Candidatus Nanopelagicales bacterium]